jgi:hypothetical protein
MAYWVKSGLGAAATVVSVPYAAHGTVEESPCALQIAVKFLVSAVVDNSCLKSILPPDFDGALPDTAALAKQYFNSTLWGEDAQ